MTTAAVYLRISKDKALGTESEGQAVNRQRKAIHALLKSKNWEIGKEYVDNDVSASGKVKRPAYEQMLADFEAGEFDSITAWKLDRLWRVPKELEHIIELVERTSLTVATAEGDIDLNTGQGRVMARVLTAFAQDELDKRSSRQKARFAQDREAGHHHWRGKRPFGLTLEGKLVPEEAKAIQDIAKNIILDGGTISAGVELLNERGILTTFGKPWQRQPLRRTLLHPRLAGMRVHDGELIKGNWEKVLDRETWQAVYNTLKTPNRAKPKKTEREYFLSGLLRCGFVVKVTEDGTEEKCGAKCYGQVRAAGKTGNRKATWIYRCSVNTSHVSKSMVQTDRLVTLQTVMALHSVDYQEVEADKNALKALREDRAFELKYWHDWQAEAHKEGLRPSEIRPARDLHEARLHAIDRKIAEMEKVSLVRLPTPEEEEEGILKVFDWEGLSLEKRRRLVETVWESITLRASGKGARWSDENVVMVPRNR